MDIRTRIFPIIADLAETAYQNNACISSAALMSSLEEQGLACLGNPDRIARQIIQASHAMAEAMEDSSLMDAIASSFTDKDGWPLLVEEIPEGFRIRA